MSESRKKCGYIPYSRPRIRQILVDLNIMILDNDDKNRTKLIGRMPLQRTRSVFGSFEFLSQCERASTPRLHRNDSLHYKLKIFEPV